MRRQRKEEENNFKLTRPQQKALKREIRAQMDRVDENYYLDLSAAVLWVLHIAFGFGPKRLRRFFDAFTDLHKKLRGHYELEDSDNGVWIVRMELKKIGVDVEAWEKECE